MLVFRHLTGRATMCRRSSEMVSTQRVHDAFVLHHCRQGAFVGSQRRMRGVSGSSRCWRWPCALMSVSDLERPACVRVDSGLNHVQVPMSKYEQSTYLDDRYKAMDERLKVRSP